MFKVAIVGMVVAAIIDFLDGHARLLETASNVTVEQVLAGTEATLIVPDRVVTMPV